MNAIKRSPTKWIMIAMIFFGLAACQKHLKENEDEILSSSNGNHGGDDQTKKYSSKVARDWLNMQLRVIQSTAYPFAGVTSRFMGYIGVALYESVVPGMPSYQSLNGQLNGLDQKSLFSYIYCKSTFNRFPGKCIEYTISRGDQFLDIYPFSQFW
jgi:hypothetical protein